MEEIMYQVEDEKTINAVYERMIRRYDELEKKGGGIDKPKRPQTIDYSRSVRSVPSRTLDIPRRTGSVSGTKAQYDLKVV
jgi:hypothetical protein